MKKGKSRFDDQSLIDWIEKYFIEKRKYVVKMPRAGGKVILLLSGGMDSIVAWGWLMEYYKLQVYPIHVVSETETRQQKSVKLFSKYYKERFPELFVEPFFFRGNYFPLELEKALNLSAAKPEQILEVYSRVDEKYSAPYFRGVSMVSAFFGATYSEYLKLKFGLNINTVLCGVTALDGKGVWSQTKTFMRTTMLNLSLYINNPRLQFTSIYYEDIEGRLMDKSDIIKVGKELGIPLEKTFSCYRQNWWHCGECGGCVSRKEGFKKAGIVDPTIYLIGIKNKLFCFLNKANSVIGSLKKKFRRLF